MEKNETINKHINENPDSIEIGNSKSGVVKIYFDALKPEECRTKIENAIKILLEVRDKVYGEQQK